MHNTLTLEGNMGNDNITKEIEKIKQEINKEVRGKGKWIGDKYVYISSLQRDFISKSNPNSGFCNSRVWIDLHTWRGIVLCVF